MTQKIAYARSGDRLSARYVNRLVDGANLALQVLNPARSKRLPDASSFTPELDDEGNGTIQGIGTRIYSEEARASSLIDVNGVTISRIERVTLKSDTDEIMLIFDND